MLIQAMKRIEASLSIGSAAEAAIRDVMLKDIKNVLETAPDVVPLLKDQLHVMGFLAGIISTGEVKVPATFVGYLDSVIRQSRTALFALEPQFAHQINGRWYYSTDLPQPPESLEDYRQQVRSAYDSLRGVKFATRGVDYDLVSNGHPVKMGEPEVIMIPDPNPEPAEPERLFRNSYRCPNDGEEWDDRWSCPCNDHCPKCDAEIEPFESVELDPETGEEKGDGDALC